MKEGSEGGDGGGSSDDIPTSRDADSTVSNGATINNGPTTRIGLAATVPLSGTALANALLGISSNTNGGSNGEGLPGGVHSTNNKVARGSGDPNNREKSFVCNICRRGFGYKHVLQNHERTHTGEKPFECKECHKRFTRDHHLKTHMRLHTGEKPYHCSHCDRHFVQVANLRRHLRVHTGERPYACTLCNSCFSDSNQLKAHRLIHAGIKPYECTLCKGRFRRRHHMVHHKCPMDEANIGKPRRGRRPKAYDELPTMLLPVKHERLPTPLPDLAPLKQERLPTPLPDLAPLKQERLPTPLPDMDAPPPYAVALKMPSVITRGGPSPPQMPQPAHMQQPRRNNHHPIHHPLLGAPNGGSRFLDTTVQTGPLDMTVSSSASAPVSVIVPRIPYRHHPSVEGVLDLSNSRSDSEAEPIEEEVDEEDDCIDEGGDSEDSEDEEHLRMIACWKQREDNNRVYHHLHHPEDLRRRVNDSESEMAALHLTTTS